MNNKQLTSRDKAALLKEELDILREIPRAARLLRNGDFSFFGYLCYHAHDFYTLFKDKYLDIVDYTCVYNRPDIRDALQEAGKQRVKSFSIKKYRNSLDSEMAEDLQYQVNVATMQKQYDEGRKFIETVEQGAPEELIATIEALEPHKGPWKILSVDPARNSLLHLIFARYNDDDVTLRKIVTTILSKCDAYNENAYLRDQSHYKKSLINPLKTKNFQGQNLRAVIGEEKYGQYKDLFAKYEKKSKPIIPDRSQAVYPDIWV